MDDNQYAPDNIQRQALKTWYSDGSSLREQRIHALLGLAGETGELVDLMKKHFYKPGRETTQDKVKDELSDVLYYVAVLSHLWGFTFEDMTAHLAVKLAGGHGWRNDGHHPGALDEQNSSG